MDPAALEVTGGFLIFAVVCIIAGDRIGSTESRAA